MLVVVLLMSPLKKKAIKKSSKHPCISSDSFRNDNASMAFLDHYKRAPIVLERSVDLRVPKGHLHSRHVQRKDIDKVAKSDG